MPACAAHWRATDTGLRTSVPLINSASRHASPKLTAELWRAAEIPAGLRAITQRAVSNGLRQTIDHTRQTSRCTRCHYRVLGVLRTLYGKSRRSFQDNHFHVEVTLKISASCLLCRIWPFSHVHSGSDWRLSLASSAERFTLQMNVFSRRLRTRSVRTRRIVWFSQ